MQAYDAILIKLEKMAISDVLSLEADIPPVVIGFNYAASFPDSTHSAPTYQISAKPNNLRQRYCDLNMSNLGADSHLGFDRK